MKTKTVHPVFLAYQDKEKETWLEAKAAKGWHFAKRGLLGDSFVRGEPRYETYRMGCMVRA